MTQAIAKHFPSWKNIPLYLQIAIALILAIGLGACLRTQQLNPNTVALINNLAIPCNLVLKALRALATPLIMLAVLHSFLTAHIPGKSGRRLVFFLLTNTLVAILIGLLVANILKPGTWSRLNLPSGTSPASKPLDPWGLLADSVPASLVQPLVDNNVLQVVFIALVVCQAGFE